MFDLRIFTISFGSSEPHPSFQGFFPGFWRRSWHLGITETNIFLHALQRWSGNSPFSQPIEAATTLDMPNWRRYQYQAQYAISGRFGRSSARRWHEFDVSPCSSFTLTSYSSLPLLYNPRKVTLSSHYSKMSCISKVCPRRLDSSMHVSRLKFPRCPLSIRSELLANEI